MIKLEDGERIDFVNDKLKLLQKPQGLTFGTDALLLAGYVNESGALGAELGSGSGIISMLLLTRDKLASATAIEVQICTRIIRSSKVDFRGISAV